MFRAGFLGGYAWSPHDFLYSYWFNVRNSRLYCSWRTNCLGLTRYPSFYWWGQHEPVLPPHAQRPPVRTLGPSFLPFSPPSTSVLRQDRCGSHSQAACWEGPGMRMGDAPRFPQIQLEKFAVEEERLDCEAPAPPQLQYVFSRAAAGIIEGRFTTEWDLGSEERELASPGAALLGAVGCERSTTCTRSIWGAGRASWPFIWQAGSQEMAARESSPLTSELFLGLDRKQWEIMLFALMMRLISSTSHENSNPNPTK